MHSTCAICGLKFSGSACLNCTQQSINLADFGLESLSRGEEAKSQISSRTPLGDDHAKLKHTVDGKIYALSKPSCRIGTDSENDIVISDDEDISRFHALISFDAKENEYVVRDLGSRVGTFINGSQVHLDEAVFDGDMIKIGRHKFYFISDLKN